MRHFLFLLLVAAASSIKHASAFTLHRPPIQSYRHSMVRFVAADEQATTPQSTVATENSASSDDSGVNGEATTTTEVNGATDAGEKNEKSRDERLKEEMEKANKLRVGELKSKLSSMGVDTKTFLEKSEFVKALAEAIVDGVKEKPRSERIEEEYRKANDMAIHDLLDGLREMGVDTRSFNVKSEFARAYAEAKVDGVRKPTPEEVAKSQEYDASYRDVVMMKIDSADMRLHQGILIDISLKL